MISKRFENTKNINLFFVFAALLFGLFLYEFFIFEDSWDVNRTLIRLGSSLILLVSMIYLNTIDRWNELTESNSYSIFFFGIFSIIFPHIYNNIALVTSNLLIIITIWRIMMLRTEENIPQKIFDASFLIICAGLLNVWAFIFLLNVWISLLYYGSKKRKYWLIPFVAVFCIGVLFSAGLLLTGTTYQLPLHNLWQLDYQDMLFLPTLTALIITAVMFVVSLMVYFFKSTYHSGSSQVIIQFLLVGLIVVFFSKEVIFVFAPLSILFALYIEKIERFWLKETILWVFLTIPLAILLLHFIAKG